MLNYNDITEKKYIVYENEPYEVLESDIKKKNRQKPVNQTKLRNLITGRVVQESFHQSDKVEEAEIDKIDITYQFSKYNRQTNSAEYWFIEGDDRSKRISLNPDLVSNQIKFIKEGQTVTALTFDENIIGIQLPIKVELKVIESPPAVRGNTEGSVTKQVKVETGATVNVPIFIKEDDVIVIKTDTGEYVERV